jgi:ribokinase
MGYDVIVVGSCVADLAFYTNSSPKLGQTVTGNFESGLGGKGFNQAVASARSGAKTLFIGAVGNDLFGKDFKEFKEPNLTVNLIPIRSQPTGAASIVVDSKGNNSIVVALGANEFLSINHLQKYRKFFSKARVLLLQRETSDKLLNDLIPFVRSINPKILIILNPAPCDSSFKLDHMVDFITPNETELQSLLFSKPSNLRLTNSKKVGPQLNKIINSIMLSDKLKFRYCLVTLGALGSYLYPTNIYKEVIKVEEVIDTSGAGDAFNGAFAAGLARYDHLGFAMELATIVAGLSVTKKGTSKSIPASKIIQQFFQRR